MDADGDYQRSSSAAKLLAGQLATKIAGMAVQVCGAHGTQETNPFGRYFRDAKAYEVAGGSNEVLKNTYRQEPDQIGDGTMTFTELLRMRVERDDERPFLVYGDAVITWGHAVAIVARLATLLVNRGVREGDRVLLACGNSPTFIYGWFALRWVGASCVPLHTGATTEAVRAMIGNAGISMAIADSALHRRGRCCSRGSHCSTDLRFLPASGVRRFSVRDRWQPGAARQARKPASSTPQEPPAPRRAWCSASARSPQAELSWRSALAITPDDRILLALPLFHTNPQVYGVMVAVATGCSLAIMPRFKPSEFLEYAAKTQATGFTYVGTLLQLILPATPTRCHLPACDSAPVAVRRRPSGGQSRNDSGSTYTNCMG